MLMYILKNSKILEPNLACSILLQNNLCYFESEPLTWKIEIKEQPQGQQQQVSKL